MKIDEKTKYQECVDEIHFLFLSGLEDIFEYFYNSDLNNKICFNIGNYQLTFKIDTIDEKIFETKYEEIETYYKLKIEIIFYSKKENKNIYCLEYIIDETDVDKFEKIFDNSRKTTDEILEFCYNYFHSENKDFIKLKDISLFSENFEDLENAINTIVNNEVGKKYNFEEIEELYINENKIKDNKNQEIDNYFNSFYFLFKEYYVLELINIDKYCRGENVFIDKKREFLGIYSLKVNSLNFPNKISIKNGIVEIEETFCIFLDFEMYKKNKENFKNLGLEILLDNLIDEFEMNSEYYCPEDYIDKKYTLSKYIKFLYFLEKNNLKTNDFNSEDEILDIDYEINMKILEKLIKKAIIEKEKIKDFRKKLISKINKETEILSQLNKNKKEVQSFLKTLTDKKLDELYSNCLSDILVNALI